MSGTHVRNIAKPAWGGYDLPVTTTVNVSDKGQVELPKEYRRRKKIKPGMALRVTEVGEGLYITPVQEPNEKELREVIAAAGSLTHAQTEVEESLVQNLIRDYRAERRTKGR